MTTNSKQYPFTTKGEIRARLAADLAFVVECAVLLESRTRGRTAGVAPVGVSWGWMSSERVVAGRLVEAARAGTTSEGDMTKLRGMVTRYAKQIADHFRQESLREHPELLETARLFSVVRGAEQQPPKATLSAASALTEPVAVDGTPGEEDDSEPEESGVGTAPPPADLVARVLASLREQPGSRTEELATVLGNTTAEVGAAIRSLMDEKKVMKRGKARGTRYFPR